VLSGWRKRCEAARAALVSVRGKDSGLGQVELEAVHSQQVYVLHWRELTDASLWRQGWV